MEGQAQADNQESKQALMQVYLLRRENARIVNMLYFLIQFS